MKKKLVLFLCLITCLFAMSACSKKNEKASFEYDKEQLESMATDFMDSWNKFDFNQVTEESIESAIKAGQMDEDTAAAYRSWKTVKESIGEFDEILSKKIEESKDNVTVIITSKYKGTKNKVEFRVAFDSKLMPEEKNVTVEEIETLSSKLEFAGLNTILGMGTVFVVLIFISLIIALFGYIPKIQAKFAKKNADEVNVVESIDNTVSQIVEQEEELVDDGELVAVVTAAIMASMGDEVPADGLVVRSIKRAKTNKWQKA